MERFFEEVYGRLKAVRQADSDNYRGFFDALKPTLEMAEKLDRELNRYLAQRFNALEYLRTDELGLSRIIADLLEAGTEAAHGQGPLFLRTFLTKLGIGLTLSDSDLEQAGVSREQKTANGRYIDIYVEIPSGDGTFRFGIENKPYADDSENQVRDYLTHLRSESKPGDDFLLIYLSPSGEGPSEHSLPSTELKSWPKPKQFTIMPYHGQYSGGDTDDRDQAKDVSREYRAPFSLTDWLAACREKCQVERVRWFLGETESFCQRQFGDQTMTTSSEANALEKYLHANPDHFLTAQVIYDSWAGIKKRIIERFLKHLHDRIKYETKTKLRHIDDLKFGCEYSSDGATKCNLFFYRQSWKEYKDAPNTHPKTFTIWLQNQEAGPKKFMYGVASPLEEDGMNNEGDKTSLRCLKRNLQQEMSGAYKQKKCFPTCTYVDESLGDWNKLLPNLHRECEKNGGDITDWYVEKLIELATKAIPIIDEIESPCHPNQARNSTS